MGKHRNFDHKDVLYASWTDALQEFISNYAQGARMYKVKSDTVGVKASSGTGQVAIGFGGPWRYVSEDLSVLVSGGAGTKDIYVVAVTENDFVGAGEDPDETDYDFELRVVNHEATPSSVAYYRKLGEVTWDGAAITALKQTLDSVSGAMLDDEAMATGDITWTRNSSGALVASYTDATVTSRKFKPTSGIKSMSGESGVKLNEGSMANVTGTELKITPSVASKLIVTAIYDMAILAGGNVGQGTISVDGVDQTAHAYHGPEGSQRDTVSQVYEVSLTAAEHTIWQRAMQSGGSPFNLLWPQGTRYHYLLVAS